jgi:hypothetical protein
MSYSHGAPSLYQANDAIDIMCQHAKDACSIERVRTVTEVAHLKGAMS